MRAADKASRDLLDLRVVEPLRLAARILTPAFLVETVNGIAPSLCLCQSEYALDHLKGLPIRAKMDYLSDYINEAFLRYDYESELDGKRDLVVYNPLKGAEFTRKLLNALGRKMPSAEVAPAHRPDP